MRDNFTVVVLPDTQKYLANGLRHQDVFACQIDWILENRDKANIAFVSHVGDIVESDDRDEAEWRIAKALMRKLDGRVPYGFCPGNHDMTAGGAARLYPFHFPPEHYRRFPWWAGDANQNRVNCQLFSACGVDVVVVHLQFMATDQDLEWALQAFRRHKSRYGILTSHIYLGEGRPGDRSIQITTRESRLAIGNWDVNTFAAKKPMNRQGDNAGADILEKVVRKASNVRIVLSGHYDEYELISAPMAGRTVHQFVTDFQSQSDGGNGWLQLFEFLPHQGVIRECVFSPWTGRYWNDREVEHELKYEPVCEVQSASSL